MDNALKQILENQVLNEGIKNALVEAWETKLSEARQQIEEQVRDEMAKRYEHDKGHLVETMEMFLNEHLAREVKVFADTKKKISENANAAQKAMARKAKSMKGVVIETLRKELEAMSVEKKALAEERVKLNRQIASAKKIYEAKAHKDMTNLQEFVTTQLKGEIAEFAQDKKELSEERIKLHKELRESRVNYKDAFADRISKLEKFVLTQLQEELGEFETDKKLLEARRVELESTAKTKIQETQKAFIAKASKLVEKTMVETMKTEMVQLKEDLKVARENNFGRMIFEAYAAEYMTSYLSEGSEVKKLKNMITEVKKELAKKNNLIVEKETQLSIASRKVKLAEERAERSRIMNELITPLARDQKTVMSNLLEGVKTEKLHESFKRYLPAVLRETGVRSDEVKKILVETNKTAQPISVAVTGDRKTRLNEDLGEKENDPGVIQLRKLAGLN